MKLRNRGAAVDLYRPAGGGGSRYVAADGEVDIVGELAEEQPADAIVLICSGIEQAWPAETWELVSDADHEKWRARRPENAEPVVARGKTVKPPKE